MKSLFYKSLLQIIEAGSFKVEHVPKKYALNNQEKSGCLLHNAQP